MRNSISCNSLSEDIIVLSNTRVYKYLMEDILHHIFWSKWTKITIHDNIVHSTESNRVLTLPPENDAVKVHPQFCELSDDPICGATQPLPIIAAIESNTLCCCACSSLIFLFLSFGFEFRVRTKPFAANSRKTFFFALDRWKNAKRAAFCMRQSFDAGIFTVTNARS